MGVSDQLAKLKADKANANLKAWQDFLASNKTKEGVAEIMTKFVIRRTKLQVGINIPGCTIEKRIVVWKNKAEKEMSENIHKAIKHATNETRLSLYLQARQCCILPELAMRTQEIVEKSADDNDTIQQGGEELSFTYKYTSKMV
jgi:hypothetical protein